MDKTWKCYLCNSINSKEKHFCNCGKVWICGNFFDECNMNDINEDYCFCGVTKCFGKDDFIKTQKNEQNFKDMSKYFD